MAIGLILGIAGGLFGGMSKIILIALCFSLLSVAIYFNIGNGYLFKISLAVSILLLLFDVILGVRRRSYE